MDQNVVDTSRPAGFGVDANPENDPTYPMRDRSRDDGPGMNWTRPTQQEPSVEVLMSVEYRRLPAVFGTTVPPSGLSGAIRRGAFNYSESQLSHWLLLMLADRVNVVEGVAQDLARGRVPNVPKEMGLRGREAAVANAAIVSVAALAVGFLVLRSRRRRQRVAY